VKGPNLSFGNFPGLNLPPGIGASQKPCLASPAGTHVENPGRAAKGGEEGGHPQRGFSLGGDLSCQIAGKIRRKTCPRSAERRSIYWRDPTLEPPGGELLSDAREISGSLKTKGAVGADSIEPEYLLGPCMSMLFFHLVNVPSGNTLKEPEGKEVSLLLELSQQRSSFARKVTQGGVENPRLLLEPSLTQPGHQSAHKHGRSEVAEGHNPSGADIKSVAHLPGKIVPGDPHHFFKEIFP
jgi:hypothetical protein